MTDEPLSEPVPDSAPPPLPGYRPRRERLPGTYAGNYLQDDPDPTRGAVILGLLFGTAFLFEAFGHFTAIFSGFGALSDTGTLLRVGSASLALILFWVGVGWARWPLAALAFFLGVSLLIQTVAASAGYYDGRPGVILNYSTTPDAAQLTHRVEGVALLARGVVYLGVSLYLVFSSNIASLAKHQQNRAKAFSLVPVVTLGGLALLGLMAMRPLCEGWAAGQQKGGLVFGDDSIRAIAEHWDYQAFDARADPAFIEEWSAEAQRATFGSLAQFGAWQRMDAHSVKVRGGLERNGAGFEWRGSYSGTAAFEHGRGVMTFEIRRGLFSPWRISSWSFSPK